MDVPSLSGFEGLTDIGLRGGVDMRPTLLRVLTDLYVQKLTHTADEERHYTELALRLLESVDVKTRATVAERLAHHLSPPARVIQWLAADLPEVAVALRSNRPAKAGGAPAGAEPNQSGNETAKASAIDQERTAAPAVMDAGVAGELNELFFAANAGERCLILRNLDIVASLQAGRPGIAPDPTIGRKLEAAALARKREDFVRELARALRISRQQAQRIADDELGEPITVAAKALSIPRDLLYRILLFVNKAVGHSVERVHALAELYDEMSVQAAQDLVAVWQALYSGKNQREGAHRPAVVDDNSGLHPASDAKRAPLSSDKLVRREAS